ESKWAIPPLRTGLGSNAVVILHLSPSNVCLIRDTAGKEKSFSKNVLSCCKNSAVAPYCLYRHLWQRLCLAVGWLAILARSDTKGSSEATTSGLALNECQDLPNTLQQITFCSSLVSAGRVCRRADRDKYSGALRRNSGSNARECGRDFAARCHRLD